MGDGIATFLVRWRRRATLLILLLGIASVSLGAFTNGARQQSVSFGIGSALIAAAVVAFIAVETDLFDRDLVERIRGLGIDRGFSNREHLGDEFWLGLIGSARRRYDVVGVANHGYWGTAESGNEFEEAFRSAIARRRMQMRIYFLNPESQYASDREKEEQHRRTRVDTVEAIDRFWQLRLQVDADQQGRLQLFEYEATPSCGMTRSDDQLIVTLYMAGRLNLRAPGLILNVGGGELSGAYTAQFEEIHARSSIVTDARLAELRVKRAEWEAAAPELRSEGEIRQLDEQGDANGG